MLSSSDFLHQLDRDRQEDLLEAAAARRAAGPSRVRRRFAQSLRHAADRLDDGDRSLPLDERRTPRTRLIPRVRAQCPFRNVSISDFARGEPATSATPWLLPGRI